MRCRAEQKRLPVSEWLYISFGYDACNAQPIADSAEIAPGLCGIGNIDINRLGIALNTH